MTPLADRDDVAMLDQVQRSTDERMAAAVALAAVAAVRAAAERTPNPCEGSMGDLLDTFAWQCEDDLRRLDRGDTSEWESDDPAQCYRWLAGNAAKTLARWLA